jgi:flavin reductase (DIM6/NTAB) family NADH-FMN oxidoreductase RutF
MPRYTKKDFPVSEIRRFLEPGPIVLVSSACEDETNIMTMGWHMMMEFSPALVGCLISSGNYSFELVRKSVQCVINVPTVDIAAAVVEIGNCSGRDTDKFSEFGLTPKPGTNIRAPLIDQCYANFECRLADDSWVNKYNVFVFEVVKAHVATSPKLPKTMHYRGNGEFMISGAETAKYRKLFRPGMLYVRPFAIRGLPKAAIAPFLSATPRNRSASVRRSPGKGRGSICRCGPAR